MIGAFLLFGFLLGVKHALEPDHVAAVASLLTRSKRAGDHVKLAALWGLGHAAVVGVVGGLVILLGVTLREPWPRLFEAAVGLMLMALGVDVLRRMRQNRVHVHSHRHEDGTLHLHAHSHPEHVRHEERHPRHEHAHVPASRAVLVGGVHGLAGSAALVLLAVQGSSSTVVALGCLAAFGVGSVLGMMLFSLALSIPLRLSSDLGRLSRAVQGGLGVATIALGGAIFFAALLGA